MPKYSIDISREGDNWVAVVPELLAVGRGKDPASAVDDALEKARTTEKALLDSNLADHDRAGHLRVRIRQSRLLAVAGEAGDAAGRGSLKPPAVARTSER